MTNIRKDGQTDGHCFGGLMDHTNGDWELKDFLIKENSKTICLFSKKKV